MDLKISSSGWEIEEKRRKWGEIDQYFGKIEGKEEKWKRGKRGNNKRPCINRKFWKEESGGAG